MGKGALESLDTNLATTFDVPIQDNYCSTADIALDGGHSEQAIKTEIRRFIAGLSPHGQLHRLTQVRWTAVISACLDSFFDQAFQDATDQRPTAQAVTVLSEPSLSLPPRHIPVIKLLGSVHRDDFVFSTVSYTTRRSSWQRAARLLADRLRGAPLVTLGMSECPWVLVDLLGVMTAEQSSTPSTLIFTETDSLSEDSNVRRFLVDRASLVLAPSIAALVGSAAAAEDAARQDRLPYEEPEHAVARALTGYADFVTVVNAQLRSAVALEETNRLHDLLFSPSVPKWDPWVHRLDFERTVTRELVADVQLLSASKTAGSSACVLIGASASGKTTVLKRVALELARQDELVLWLTPWFFQDTVHVLLNVFRAMAQSLSRGANRAVIVMDDPVAFGALTPSDVIRTAESVQLEVVLLGAARTSDWETRDEREFGGPVPVIRYELADTFDNDEWDALPPYLAKLGIFSSEDSARTAVGARTSREARDTLSLLYLFLPGSQAAIASSIRDEYFRLGDSSPITRVLVGNVEHSSELAKRAYECTAVAGHYNSSLPVEVLVSTLGVGYDEWLETASTEGPIWGLLYADTSPREETLFYRTRNAVVTRVVLNILNGGTFSHSGEVRVLTHLLSSCTGSLPAYREFCVRTLVPNDKLRRLEYDEGLRLYDAALDALPLDDRTLLHHKGLWIKNRGSDPVEARRILLSALEAKEHPYASKGEPSEHIYTSLAANELDALDQRAVSLGLFVDLSTAI